MKKNDLYKRNEIIIRILDIKKNKVLVIDCMKMTMPEWTTITTLDSFELCSKEELYTAIGFEEERLEDVTTARRNRMYKRYTLIAGIIPLIGDKKMRSLVLNRLSKETRSSKQTIRDHLCKYLSLQNIQALLPKERSFERDLTDDEKIMRWSLNKYYFTGAKNSLPTAYKMMLAARYCDENGKLQEEYPTYYQFRYFYRKTRKLQNYYISRDGLTNYQRNNRPCTGDGVQEYAPAPGVGMVDATPCDIYLVNESGKVVGRPVLTACVDAYSGMCCGYSLSWEGGVYSIRALMLNTVENKVAHCKKFGISITEEEWPCAGIPGKIVSDQGSEYIGYDFEQMTELGVTIVNLPSYRPELKGIVEKFFDIIQDEFKPFLKGKGVIEPDFQERGVHDYRKDACLTLKEFEQIIIRCIIYYNAGRVLDNYPYTKDMIADDISPYACSIFQYGLERPGANFIQVSKEYVVLSLLPRTEAKFSRFGLKVNKLRYRHDGYTEEYLSEKDATVAFDPDDVSFVWLITKSGYVRFELIESRYEGEVLSDVMDLKGKQKMMVREEKSKSLQSNIDLSNHIRAIVDHAYSRENKGIKNMRETRRKEEIGQHISFAKEVGLHD